MKRTIAIASLILGLGTSVFAATPAKTATVKEDAAVSFTALTGKMGFAVKVDAEKTMVIISDTQGNVLFKDRLSKGLPTEKAYVINRLEVGDYTVEVKGEKTDVVKQLHVYDNGDGKDWFFIQ